MGGLLLGRRGRPNAVTVVAPLGGQHESYAGKFLLRLRDANGRYELDARLQGGRITRVLRNPFRHTIIFEGETFGLWGQGGAAGGPSNKPEVLEERLIVRLPSSCDLSTPPLQVERNFSAGHCFVVVQVLGSHAEDLGNVNVVVREEEMEL